MGEAQVKTKVFWSLLCGWCAGVAQLGLTAEVCLSNREDRVGSAEREREKRVCRCCLLSGTMEKERRDCVQAAYKNGYAGSTNMDVKCREREVGRLVG